MLDIKYIRDHSEEVIKRLKTRGFDAQSTIEQLLDFDAEKRKAETDQQTYRSQANTAAKSIGKLIANKQDPAEAKNEVKQLKQQIQELETVISNSSKAQQELLLSIPNLPYAECPIGSDEEANPIIRTIGVKPDITNPLNHVELAEKHGLIHFEEGAKIAGSGYAVYRGVGARLERALIQFLLDVQTEEHGYEEVNVPHIVKRECMEGTGQLPKFEEDMYGIENNSLFLAPTAEVPVTNLYRDTLLKEEQLPIKMTAHTPCFRREAGSAGKENKGIIRMHQFDKVELVQIVTEENAQAALDSITSHAEAILQKLGLHYRVIELCTGDLGFSSKKTYDIEVWSPGQDKFLEVSSCSHFGDFQARRMKLRYKNADGKNVFCHTLNGSGTALPRLYVALIEQYQQKDGSIALPEALQPYMRRTSIETA